MLVINMTTSGNIASIFNTRKGDLWASPMPVRHLPSRSVSVCLQNSCGRSPNRATMPQAWAGNARGMRTEASSCRRLRW